MAVTSFIPELWSSRLLAHLDKAQILVNRCNREYEGEISQFGDTVKIGQIGNITIANYVPNVTSITPQELSASQTLLTIDKANYFAFKIDDVDQAQTKPKLMDAAMQRSAYGLGDTVDALIGGLHTEAGTSLTTPGSTVNSASVLEVLGAMQQALDEKDVPAEGRWLVVSPWVNTKIAIARIIQTEGSVNAERAWDTGYVGRAMGFDIYVSNNIVTTGTAPSYTSKILAGHPSAITFAEQIVSVEAYRPEASFSDAVKGLHVYGYKVIQPNALVVCTAVYKAEA
jgi:hypothetical protein